MLHLLLHCSIPEYRLPSAECQAGKMRKPERGIGIRRNCRFCFRLQQSAFFANPTRVVPGYVASLLGF
jgi:hypothetical protein